MLQVFHLTLPISPVPSLAASGTSASMQTTFWLMFQSIVRGHSNQAAQINASIPVVLHPVTMMAGASIITRTCPVTASRPASKGPSVKYKVSGSNLTVPKEIIMHVIEIQGEWQLSYSSQRDYHARHRNTR